MKIVKRKTSSPMNENRLVTVGSLMTPRYELIYNNFLELEPGLEFEILHIDKDNKYINAHCCDEIFLNLQLQDFMTVEEFLEKPASKPRRGRKNETKTIV